MPLKTLTALAVLLVAPSALAKADLVTSIAASPATAQVYASARYTVTVTNIGNKRANAVTVAVALPATHTSPQVYVLGVVGAYSGGCSLAGTTLSCSLGNVNKNASRSVFVDLALPVSSAPLELSAVAATTSGENSTANNGSSLVASQSYVPTPVSAPVTMVNRHCTGTGLTAWLECTLFPSSISSHQATFHPDGSITIPGEPAFSGGWTLVGTHLSFYYDDGNGVVATFEGEGADGTCFEGLTTFPGGPWVAPYEVCPL